ncbi:acylphosphatase [Kitasatospora aureofaciens]|uniref:acylphosphatase n=1 Tax=Kitasatospora aureofaciens TaxID=1894 RepID=UPI001C48271A|nr:acylphosphatase [Kitasatospora aureofaciens]MBV6702036.1 acylphosphatase [Kitasatospora aureofaciens]
MIRNRVIVSGLVQGVFFRDSCRLVAEQHGVNGWVRNLPDGTVEAVFEGAPAAVAQLLRWSHHGPGSAVVEHVSRHEETPEGLTGFEVRPTPR